MTVLPQVLTLLVAGLSLYLVASSGVKHGADHNVTLAERVGALERLLLHQNTRVEQIEADRQELTDKAASLTDKVASLTDKVASLAAENQMLRDRDSVLSSRIDKLEKENQSPETRDHNVAARSDDAGPLEVVVAQMAQRLTEVSAEVQANQAEVRALKNSHTADIQTLTHTHTIDIQTLTHTHTIDIQTLKTVDQQHVQAIQEAATSTYTRWGHSACPASNSLVYSGVIGGDWYDHPGAATNYLCLAMSPVLRDHTWGTFFAEVHGTEYLTGDSHQDKNAVCAVCRSPHPAVVMVPGTNVCWPGWTLEYSGYLMSGHWGNTAGSEYICVDIAMEHSNSGDGRQRGAYLVYTKSLCGFSLPCSPYVHDKLVTCAVCSK